MIAAIFTNVDVLGGWSAAEVALLFGLSGVSFGLGDLLISPVENASIRIKAGTFDQFLIRPVGVLWQLCAVEFAARRLGRTIQPLDRPGHRADAWSTSSGRGSPRSRCR